MRLTRRAVLGSALTLPATRWATADPEPLPLGALFPFTGMLALFGDECYRGLEIAADEQNAVGGVLGRPVKLVKGDAFDPNAAVSEVKRLLGTEKVPAVFGTFASPLVLAASQITELAAIPYFELDAIADPVMQRGFRSLYRSCPGSQQVAVMSVDLVADTLAPAWGRTPGAVRVAILYEDGLSGSTIGDGQEAHCKARDLVVADKLAYSAATTDLSAAVQRLRGENVTVLLHTGYQNDTVLLFRQMKQLGWQPRMVVGAGGGYALADVAATLGADFDGAVTVCFPPYATAEAFAPGLRAVESTYEKTYGGQPRSGHSLASYVGARLFFAAIGRAGGFDNGKVHEAVLASGLDPGHTANGWGARFDDKGVNTQSFPVVAQWRAGTLHTILPREAATAALRPEMRS